MAEDGHRMPGSKDSGADPCAQGVRGTPDLSPKDLRLGELLASYQEGVPVPRLREQAGDLFPELAEVIECLELLNAGCGRGDDQDLPKSIGRFRIDARLGAGASGIVYRARDGDRPVALKVLRDALALSEDAVTRFHREVSAARSLDHDHIAKVFDHGEADGHLYLAAELIDGTNLAALLDRIDGMGEEERLNALDRHRVAGGQRGAGGYARRMAALFAPVAHALHHAQEKRLVHRDVKPGNMILGHDGKLRLVDFGLAKVVGEEITSTVAVLGTPGYMSPEQATGQSRSVDHRCDIYGLGASLYRALAGRLPFAGSSFAAVVSAIQTQRPAPLPAHVPKEVAAVVSRCLEKLPVDRYPDGATLAGDLDLVAEGRAPRLGRVGILRRARRFMARRPLHLAAAAALLLSAAWWFTRPARVSVDVWPLAPIVWDGRAVGEGRFEAKVARGTHTLSIALERFEPVSRTLRLGAGEKDNHTYWLRPRDPYDPEALVILARAAGTPAPPVDEPPRPRGLLDGPLPIEGDAAALRRSLARFDRTIRDEPHIRVLAVAQLLEERVYGEAFLEAKRLSDASPEAPLPARMALEALRGLGLEERPVYHELYSRLGIARPAAGPEGPRKAPTAAPRTLALLAGCTEYVNLKSHPRYGAIELYGPGNDARLLADTLVLCLGAAREDLTVLVGTEPTRANILEGLERLAREAHAGDRVVILLAGHGTQQPDLDGDEADGMDEVFLPCDVTGWAPEERRIGNAIGDDEIRERIASIRASGASVWFLLDCCHAGSGVRGAGDSVVNRNVDPHVLGVPFGGGGGAERAPIDLDGVVAMYASQSHRAAPELRLPRGAKDARWHGLFTYAVASELRRSGAQLTFRELQARLLAAYESEGTMGVVPLAEGDLDLEVFGKGRSGMPPLLVDGLVLNAGRLAGLGEGTVLAVFPPGRLGAAPLGYVEITEALLERSEVRPVARGGMPAPSLPPGPLPSRVEAVRMDFRLRLSGDVPLGLEGLFVETPRADADWILESGILRSALPGPSFRVNERDLRNLYRAQNLKRVAADAAPLPAGLVVRMSRDGRAVAPGEALRPGDTFLLEIENGTAHVQDVNVLVLDARFGTLPLFPAGRVSARLSPGEGWRSEPLWVTDTSLGVEHLVAIAVPRPEGGPEVDLGWLAQEQLTERGGAEDEIARFLKACAFGTTRAGRAEAPFGVTAALLTWRTEWPPVRLPALERPSVVVRCPMDLLGDGPRNPRPSGPVTTRERSVVAVETRLGHGAGFVVGEGRVLTSARVVSRGYETAASGRPRVLVHRVDPDRGREAVPAEVVALDEALDLALLQVEDARWSEGMRPLPLAPVGARPGAACAAVSPWATVEGRVEGTGRMPHDFADAFIEALGATRELARAQLAAMEPTRVLLTGLGGADPGSPLVDAEGRVLGVTISLPAGAKGSAHVDAETVREFLAREAPMAPLVPDPWRLGPEVGLSGGEFLVAGLDRPGQILVDVDGDTRGLHAAELVRTRAFDAEAAFHLAADRRTAFYDTDNDGSFDLILVDEDEDPEADVRFTLAGGAWRVETGLDVPWMKASYLGFEGGAALATASFRRLTG